MSNLKEKIAAMKREREDYTFAEYENSFYPVFKLRLEALQEVNPTYFKNNETEIVKSTLAAQNVIEQGADINDSGQKVTDMLNKAYKKYDLLMYEEGNNFDVNPYLLTDMVGGFLQDVEDKKIDTNGEIKDFMQVRDLKTLKVPHNSDRNGIPYNAKMRLNKWENGNIGMLSEQLCPVMKLRLENLKKVDPDFEKHQLSSVKASLAAQETHGEKDSAEMDLYLGKKYRLSINEDDAYYYLHDAFRMDLKNKIVDENGNILEPQKLASSKIMDTPLVEDGQIKPSQAYQNTPSTNMKNSAERT